MDNIEKSGKQAPPLGRYAARAGGAFILVGIIFGIVFVKAEIISWFRIQEMFRFQSFHMFGVIGTAVVVG